jgi:hypothetical protein
MQGSLFHTPGIVECKGTCNLCFVLVLIPLAVVVVLAYWECQISVVECPVRLIFCGNNDPFILWRARSCEISKGRVRSQRRDKGRRRGGVARQNHVGIASAMWMWRWAVSRPLAWGRCSASPFDMIILHHRALFLVGCIDMHFLGMFTHCHSLNRCPNGRSGLPTANTLLNSYRPIHFQLRPEVVPIHETFT